MRGSGRKAPTKVGTYLSVTSSSTHRRARVAGEVDAQVTGALRPLRQRRTQRHEAIGIGVAGSGTRPAPAAAPRDAPASRHARASLRSDASARRGPAGNRMRPARTSTLPTPSSCACGQRQQGWKISTLNTARFPSRAIVLQAQHQPLLAHAAEQPSLRRLSSDCALNAAIVGFAASIWPW